MNDNHGCRISRDTLKWEEIEVVGICCLGWFAYKWCELTKLIDNQGTVTR